MILGLDDLRLAHKTVFVRVDINTPVNPEDGSLLEQSRILEASETLNDLRSSKVVVGSHQGRVGRYDYISLEQHAKALNALIDRPVKFVADIHGNSAKNEIATLREGEILVLENLRFEKDESLEFEPKEASETKMVQDLYSFFDVCILDAFATSHRACPSIVGFSFLLPSCAGRIVMREVMAMDKMLKESRGHFTTVLGGSKIRDRLSAVETLIKTKRTDRVLLTGLIGTLFLIAKDQIKSSLGIEDEEKYVKKAKSLLNTYPNTFEVPIDVAIESNGERVELAITELNSEQKILDIGEQTCENYTRIINASGAILMSGPPGLFEKRNFEKGTHALLKALASSSGTTIISGGHLSAALEKLGIKDKIDHLSTAGGALVLYLSGAELPLIKALENSVKTSIT